ncbi:MAG: glycosyltransferase [Candidatus Krumholzibacteria bacterium]|nr:glycosyltransferase [Candidatus Krumholzibacteria bacterium]MDH4335696.1 glycosyltransferase [Candidatus Krumholzibacteria bacterium]MDH5270041.1 glycosyltransferase [Candidatus Krumholzibacteria bacterium]
MSTQPRRGRVAYVAAGFPKLTETFVLREVMEMERRGIPVSVFSVRPRPKGRLHADALPFLEKTHYAPWIGLAHFGAFFSLAVRHPLGMLRGLGFLLANMADQARYPSAVLKMLVAKPKMFLFTREMERGRVVHVHAHFANIPTTFAVFAARVLGITYSFTGHAWDIFVPVNQAALSRKISGAEFVATCTAFNTTVLARFCRTDADRHKIWRNYHGLDLSRYVSSNRRDALRIVAGGSLVEKKGLMVLVEAAALLRTRGVPFQIEMVGEGEQRTRLQQEIARHGLGDAVTLVGSMPHEDLVERMRTSAMIVLPCIETRGGYMDGIPNILIESLALGVPVVSTPISGIPELVIDGETGLLVPPHDAAALADAIEALLRDPARGSALGRAGRARVESMFDVVRNVGELVARFENILNATDRPSTRDETVR